jgi:hypothetical protein
LVFEKNTNFFTENGQKLQKIVIITSTPGHTAGKTSFVVVGSNPTIPAFAIAALLRPAYIHEPCRTTKLEAILFVSRLSRGMSRSQFHR